VNAQNSDGFTALHWAVIKGYPEAMDLIMTVENINPNLKDRQGCTALHCAVELHDAEATRGLLKCPGIDPTIRNVPLEFKRKKSFFEFIRLHLTLQQTRDSQTSLTSSDGSDHWAASDKLS
jgi:ankyrin repeat protein